MVSLTHSYRVYAKDLPIPKEMVMMEICAYYDIHWVLN